MKEQLVEIPGGLVTLVLGIAAFILIAFLLFYGGSTLYENYEVLQAEKKSLEDVTKRRDHLAQLKEKYPEVKEIKQSVTKALPNIPNDDQIITCMANVAATSATTITNIKFDVDVQKVGYYEIPFMLSLRGNMASITNAVYNMQISERPFRIDSVTTSGGAVETPVLTAQIRGGAFYIAGGVVPPVTPSP